MDRVKRIWYLKPMRAAKVQASLCIRAVSPEPSLLDHTSSESRGTFRQKAKSLAPLNGWACAVKICHDGMPEDTNSLDAPLSDYEYVWLRDNPISKSLVLILCLIKCWDIRSYLVQQSFPTVHAGNIQVSLHQTRTVHILCKRSYLSAAAGRKQLLNNWAASW